MNTIEVITKSASPRERYMSMARAAIFHYQRCIFGAEFGMTR